MMTKTCLTALAVAEGCNDPKADRQALSCAVGPAYDTASKSCLLTTG